MPGISIKRREFLQTATALAVFAPPVFAASRTHYEPSAKFELTVTELEYRRNAQGRSLMARVYQPVGQGPFPVVLDLHGGAWNAKDRHAEEPFDRALATAGALVVAVDLTLAPQAPYPAYALRWLKARAKDWKGDATRIGLFGSSSGGHVAELLALRPGDARYNAIPFAGGLTTSMGVSPDYVMMRSPISNTFARFETAQANKVDTMIKNNQTFFVPWDSIHEANPQEILERKEKVTLKPFLIMQGALDTNMLPSVQTKFVETYRAAGGSCDYTVFDGCEHEWVAKPGPQTTRAHEMAKAFIARQVSA